MMLSNSCGPCGGASHRPTRKHCIVCPAHPGQLAIEGSPTYDRHDNCVEPHESVDDENGVRGMLGVWEIIPRTQGYFGPLWLAIILLWVPSRVYVCVRFAAFLGL